MLDLNSLVGFFVLGVIGWFTYKAYIWPYYISPLRKIPGPPSENPFYGNIIKFYGMLNQPAVLVADTKIIQEISLNNAYDFIKPPNADGAALFGNGIMHVEGETHKRQRKIMMPAFSYNNIKVIILINE